jgi:hypothetical protein
MKDKTQFISTLVLAFFCTYILKKFIVQAIFVLPYWKKGDMQYTLCLWKFDTTAYLG